MKCINCGAELHVDDLFCGACGTSVSIRSPGSANATHNLTKEKHRKLWVIILLSVVGVGAVTALLFLLLPPKLPLPYKWGTTYEDLELSVVNRDSSTVKLHVTPTDPLLKELGVDSMTLHFLNFKYSNYDHGLIEIQYSNSNPSTYLSRKETVRIIEKYYGKRHIEAPNGYTCWWFGDTVVMTFSDSIIYRWGLDYQASGYREVLNFFGKKRVDPQTLEPIE